MSLYFKQIEIFFCAKWQWKHRKLLHFWKLEKGSKRRYESVKTEKNINPKKLYNLPKTILSRVVLWSKNTQNESHSQSVRVKLEKN